jgi:uncharacterized protein (TIGR02757 family)
MNESEIRDYLEEKTQQYMNRAFIDDDPISVPHHFQKPGDIECAGFITATMAWGNRKSILKNAHAIFNKMDNQPFDYIKNYNKQEQNYWKKQGSLHRTLQGADLDFLIRGLQEILQEHGTLEPAFLNPSGEAIEGIIAFRSRMLKTKHQTRSLKHLGDALSGSACKRINMFLRWMVREKKSGVDFGLWKKIKPSALSIPLDVHSGNTARMLGILQRRQNDIKAVHELDKILRKFDVQDPVKYDFALFGIGVYEPGLQIPRT